MQSPIDLGLFYIDCPIIFKDKTCILFKSFGILFLKSNGGDWYDIKRR